MVSQLLFMLTNVKPTLIEVMTDVIVIMLFTTDVFWQMLLPCGKWPLTNAFVTDVIITFCGMDPLFEVTIVTDGRSHGFSG